jgi:hypothetical protein
MMVSGRAKVEMKDGSPAALRAGDFLDLPSKHIHQFTCLAACLLFDASTGRAFRYPLRRFGWQRDSGGSGVEDQGKAAGKESGVTAIGTRADLCQRTGPFLSAYGQRRA